MNKTVIFDMDGVIINSEPLHQQIEHEIFRELGLNISNQELQAYVGTSAKNMWEELITKYNLKIERDEIILESKNRYQSLIRQKHDLKPIPGVCHFIDQLRRGGFKLLLASSASRSNIDLVLDIFEMTDHFSHKISGDELPRSKPHPDIFLTAGRLSETPNKHCVVVEDSRNGVLAAKAAGMKCIGFRNPDTGQQDLSKADLIIERFESLSLDIMRRL